MKFFNCCSNFLDRNNEKGQGKNEGNGNNESEEGNNNGSGSRGKRSKNVMNGDEG